MQNSSLIAVLQTLDKKEQREFGLWLSSPVHNLRQDVVDLYQYLIKAGHLLEDKYTEKTWLFRKIFPGETYDDAKMRQTIFFLNKNLEQYLAFKQLEEEEFTYSIAYLKALRQRKAVKVFQKKFNMLLKEGLGKKQLDSKGLRHTFTLYDEHYTLLLHQNLVKEANLQETFDIFDIQFFSERLKYACLALSHNKVFKTSYQVKFLEQILETVGATPSLLDYPAIAIYYYGYLLQTLPDASEHYYALKTTIQQHATVFVQEERKDIYLIALNYCVEQANKGNGGFMNELLELYKEGLDNEYIFQGQYLSPYTFINISTAALRLKEYDWTERFIADYAPRMEEQDRDNFRQYAQARLAFERKQYGLAQKLLSQFESKHFLVTLNARTMLLKIYFEQDETDALESLFESTNSYLRRKEIIGYHKSNYKNIITYAKKLVSANPFDKTKLVALREEIATASPLTERSWLLEQVDKLL